MSVVLKPKTILKSVRVYTVFQALEQVAAIVQSNPSVQDLEDEHFDRQFALVILTKEPGERIKEIIEGIPEIESAQVEELSPTEGGEAAKQSGGEISATAEQAASSTPLRTARQEPLVRVETERLDKLINLVGCLLYTSRCV